MASKWKYEADCKRVETLVAQTVSESKRPGWGRCAVKVLAALRLTRPKAAPLALHFIGVSAEEMLNGRHDIAELCFLVAQSIADKALMAQMAGAFDSVFSEACSCSECHRRSSKLQELNGAIKEAIENLGDKLNYLPDGLSEIQLLPGTKATIVKQSYGVTPTKKSKKALSSDLHRLRWN